jgi:hypothetical protein
MSSVKGRKPGPGRPKNSVNKISSEAVKRALSEGPLPAENMLAIARTCMGMASRYQRMVGEDLAKASEATIAKFKEWLQLTLQANAAAAPYYNHRLTALRIEDRRVDLTQLTDKELEQFESLYARASAPRGGEGGTSPSRH